MALLAIPGLARSAGEPQHSPLISQEKLQESLKDTKIRLLDARPKADYDKGHIPGAVWVDFKAIQALGKPDSIKDDAAWAKLLATLGISEEIRIVLVYDNNRQHDAARVWWSLKYAGVPKVGLVDGGFDLWEKNKRPISTDAVQVSVADFKPHLHANHLASRDEVTKGNDQLLDSRSVEEYSGEGKPKNAKAVLGHIPGAGNLDAYSLVDNEGRLLPKDTLKQRFSEAGFAVDKPVIVYSAGGNRSAITIFALEQLGGRSRHFLGGIVEWTGEAKQPVVLGKNPTK